MTAITGKWYDGRTSQTMDVVLVRFDDGAIRIRKTTDDTIVLSQSELRAKISDRLADTSRFIDFGVAGTFETKDNAGVDLLLKQRRQRHWSSVVHLLETKKRYIAIALVACVFLGAALVKYGIPLAAKLIAPLLPHSVYTLAETQTMDMLDRIVFKPTELNEEIKSRLENFFLPAVREHGDQNIRVEFRKGGKVGANAFALPAGLIIFTDELLTMADDDNQLLAVLAHEIGHVANRHAMRRVIQGSLLSFAAMMITGDSSGVSELFLGLPVILTEYAYSRDFESDADLYAWHYLRGRNIPTHHFADILSKIEKSDQDKKGRPGDKISSYISTHPKTSERIQRFREPV
jgi:Zn-dependent protease with chaperone function